MNSLTKNPPTYKPFTKFLALHKLYRGPEGGVSTISTTDLNLRVDTRTQIIAQPIFTDATLELKINCLVATRVTGLVQLLVPKVQGSSPKSYEYEEFPPDKSCTNFMNGTNRPENPIKALKLEPLAGIGSPPGTVNLVCGITYMTKNGVVISYGSEESVLTVHEPRTPEFVWRVESLGEANLPVYTDGAGNIIPFETQGGIFLFADRSMLMITQLNSVPDFTVRYILPTNPKISGAILNQQSIQDFDPTQISVFLNHKNGSKVKDGRLADLFQCKT